MLMPCMIRRSRGIIRQFSSISERLKDGPQLADFIQQGETVSTQVKGERLPNWLRTPIPTGKQYTELKSTLRTLKLATVCEEAKCPNIGECWSGGPSHTSTATIMLMGDECTRGCRFCSVKTSRTPKSLDPGEPERVAAAIKEWGVGYVVLTSVDRDDLADGGASHFAETVRALKRESPKMLVECLSGDFGGKLDLVETVTMSGLDVHAHNLETVERLTPSVRDHRATYRQSLNVLSHAKQINSNILTKSSLMLGCGEQDEEIRQTLRDLRLAGVDCVTLGQYMRPTKRHMKVEKYVHPDEFKRWEEEALAMGFLYAPAGPLVRSSYRAGEFYLEALIKARQSL